MAAWRNWSREQACRPAAIERPRRLGELRSAVARAAAAGHRVRASASGHSFTPVALTEGVMVRLDHLDGLIDIDRGSGLVKVEAGIVLRDLNRLLDRHGLAFENLGDIDRQTLAGAISTATHGTGGRFRNISAQIAALEIVGADGSLTTIDESDPSLLRAARVGLGALGIVYSATVHTVPAFTINRLDRPRPLAETLERLDELEAACDHFEFYVFPHTQTALCRESRRSDEPPRPRHPALVYGQEVVLENWAAGALAQAVRRRPASAPRLARKASAWTGRGRKVDRSYRVFASQRRIRFTEMEYAVPRTRGRELVERVLEVANRPELGVAFPIEVRFVAADDSCLSPSEGRETCYVAVHQDTKLDGGTYFGAVEQVARSLEGRPHWGKRHSRGAADLAPLYPRWDEFQAARARLDPARVFANEHIDHVLGNAAR